MFAATLSQSVGPRSFAGLLLISGVLALSSCGGGPSDNGVSTSTGGKSQGGDGAGGGSPSGGASASGGSLADGSGGGLGMFPQLPRPAAVWNQAYQENFAADAPSDIVASAKNAYVLLDPDDPEARGTIASLKESGNLVSCYMSAGTCEDWRDDFETIKPYCVSTQWGDWPGEYFVDRTNTGLVAEMSKRFDKMKSWGCQMVEFDNMDWAFDDQNRANYAITATTEEARAYLQELCSAARARGLGCMAKSTTEGAEDFDGLTVESYPADLDWWDAADLKGMLDAGRLGIIVHYNSTAATCDSVYETYKADYGSNLSFLCEDKDLKKYRHYNEAP